MVGGFVSPDLRGEVTLALSWIDRDAANICGRAQEVKGRLPKILGPLKVPHEGGENKRRAAGVKGSDLCLAETGAVAEAYHSRCRHP